jgi:hypothetical protein
MWKKREDCQKFRHHGLQRSGTNFLEGLMYRYFEVWCRNGGSGPKWKHSLEMAPFEDDMFYLVIAKNPYSWVESIAYRNPMDYIEKQKLYPAGEPISANLIAGPNKINVVNAAKTWNYFYANWKPFVSYEKVYCVKYEDLLIEEKRKSILEDIHEKFRCKWRDNPLSYKSPETSILDRNQDESKTKYYLSEKPKNLTDVQIEAITKNINKELFDFFEYEHL